MQPLSPVSVHERYSSPIAGSAKRRLFGDGIPNKKRMEKILCEGTKLKIAPFSNTAAEIGSVSPGQTVLTMSTAAVAGTSGQKVTIPLHGKSCLHVTLGHFTRMLSALLFLSLTYC